jgi:hypothetical protein
MRPSSVKLCNDVGYGFAYSGNLRQAAFGDETIQRDRKRRQAIGRSGICLGSIWIAAAQCGSHCIFPKESRDRLRIRFDHSLSPASRADRGIWSEKIFVRKLTAGAVVPGPAIVSVLGRERIPKTLYGMRHPFLFD